MCHSKKKIYTVCAHAALTVEECPSYLARPQSTPQWICIRQICQHTQVIEPVCGFCPACAVFFSPVPAHVSSEQVILNYWAYKARRSWTEAVDATFIPATRVFHDPSPTRAPANNENRSCEEEYAKDTTPEERAIQNAIGRKGEFSEDCAKCADSPRRDLMRIAMRARQATLEWARANDAHTLQRESLVASQTCSPERASCSLGDDVELTAHIDECTASFSLGDRSSTVSGLSYSDSAFSLNIDVSPCSLRSKYSRPDMLPAPLDVNRHGTDDSLELSQQALGQLRPCRRKFPQPRKNSNTKRSSRDTAAQRGSSAERAIPSSPLCQMERRAPPRGPRLSRCLEHGLVTSPECKRCRRNTIEEIAIPPNWI